VLPGNSQIVSNLFFGLQSGFSWGLLGVCQGASVPDQRVQVQNRFEESKGSYPPFKKGGAKSIESATESVATESVATESVATESVATESVATGSVATGSVATESVC
jgi:hypothetical protein